MSEAKRPHPVPPSHRPTAGPRARRAFTLVELLVVIGIIALLIALLMPTPSKARKHALEVKCAANLRSIGQALTMYTQQYGYYPGCSAGDIAVWPPRLRAFMKDTGAFVCPSQDERCEWRRGGPAPAGIAGGAWTSYGYEEGEPLLHARSSFFSYGYNMWGTGGNGDVVSGSGSPHLGLGEHVNRDPTHSGRHRELRASRVKVASKMIAVADSTVDGGLDFGIVAHRQGFSLLPNPPWPGAVHRGGANVLFCDGHVEWYAQEDLITPCQNVFLDERIRRMWNNDHQPH